MKKWDEVVGEFPKEVQDDIDSIRINHGKLEAESVAKVLERLDAEIGSLMIKLLPAAAAYAIVPISGYQVGAVSQGMPIPGTGWSSLYLGANVEFKNEALSFCVHGEQSATSNAWLHGETGLQSLAISAAPCGYCRQFLYELGTEKQFNVLLATGTGDGYTSNPLDYYLPDAFGPHDLGVNGGLMDPKDCTHDLSLNKSSSDTLVLDALSAASKCYAPYTKNYAGCAIQLSDGNIYTGRYAENAAYNPSMSPLESAITVMNMNQPTGDTRTVSRAVLVEVPTDASQFDATTSVLSVFAPGIGLEYYTAKNDG